MVVDEIAVIWSDDITTTAHRSLRGLSNGQGDNYLLYLYPQCVRFSGTRPPIQQLTGYLLLSYVVERWREALLWTWLVGKISSPDSNNWTDDDARRAWRDLGGVNGENILVVVRRKDDRKTLDPKRIALMFADEGMPSEEKVPTKYAFSEYFPFSFCIIATLNLIGYPEQVARMVIRLQDLASKGRKLGFLKTMISIPGVDVRSSLTLVSQPREMEVR